MKCFESILDFIEKTIMAIGLIAMLILILLATFTRYFGLISIPWAEEAARYCMVWTALTALSYAYKNDSHLGLSFVVDKFKGKTKALLDFIRLVLILVFNGLVAYYGTRILINQSKFPQFSPSLRIPMYFLYAAVPVGHITGSIRFVINYLKHIQVLKEGAQ